MIEFMRAAVRPVVTVGIVGVYFGSRVASGGTQ